MVRIYVYDMDTCALHGCICVMWMHIYCMDVCVLCGYVCMLLIFVCGMNMWMVWLYIRSAGMCITN